ARQASRARQDRARRARPVARQRQRREQTFMNLRINRAANESAGPAPPTYPTTGRRLVHVQAADLDRWGSRPFETIDILDLHDRPAGHLGGIGLDRREHRPMYLVVASERGAAQQRPHLFLVPVGDAWFDETA